MFSDRSGNSGYRSLGGTVAAILQITDKLCFCYNTKPVVTCCHTGKASSGQCAGSDVRFQAIKGFFSQAIHIFFKYAVFFKLIAVRYTTFE